MGELRCAECGAVAPPEAERWKAEIGDDPRDDEPPEALVFCPACWRREFGN